MLFALLPAVAFIQPALAETPTGISGFHNVTLWVYPEYDDPRLLVMLEGKVNPSEVPSNINFLVPSTAAMYSAGSKDAQGTYSGGPPSRVASQIAGWDEISYQLKTDTFRVEYYDNVITGTTDKQIAYDFRWLYPISDLTVVVQQPLKASNYSVTPAGKQTTQDQFTVYTYTYTNPDINQPLHFNISYTKTDPNPSLSSQTPAATSGVEGGLILGVTGGLVIAALAAFLIVGRLKRKRPVKAVARVRAAPVHPIARTVSTKEKFCDQCGHPVGRRFKFCPHCGSDLDV